MEIYYGWPPSAWMTMNWRYFQARVGHMYERRRQEASQRSSADFFAANQGGRGGG